MSPPNRQQVRILRPDGGPLAATPVHARRQPPQATELSYTVAELRHARWVAGALGAAAGLFVGGAITLALIGAIIQADQRRTVDTFTSGVAIGQALPDDGSDRGVRRGREPADAP